MQLFVLDIYNALFILPRYGTSENIAGMCTVYYFSTHHSLSILTNIPLNFTYNSKSHLLELNMGNFKAKTFHMTNILNYFNFSEHPCSTSISYLNEAAPLGIINPNINQLFHEMAHANNMHYLKVFSLNKHTFPLQEWIDQANTNIQLQNMRKLNSFLINELTKSYFI